MTRWSSVAFFDGALTRATTGGVRENRIPACLGSIKYALRKRRLNTPQNSMLVPIYWLPPQLHDSNGASMAMRSAETNWQKSAMNSSLPSASCNSHAVDRQALPCHRGRWGTMVVALYPGMRRVRDECNSTCHTGFNFHSSTRRRSLLAV